MQYNLCFVGPLTSASAPNHYALVPVGTGLFRGVQSFQTVFEDGRDGRSLSLTNQGLVPIMVGEDLLIRLLRERRDDLDIVPAGPRPEWAERGRP